MRDTNPDRRLRTALRRLREHRAKMGRSVIVTEHDLRLERQLLRTYRREVENGC